MSPPLRADTSAGVVWAAHGGTLSMMYVTVV